jgi:hypothetical protein
MRNEPHRLTSGTGDAVRDAHPILRGLLQRTTESHAIWRYAQGPLVPSPFCRQVRAFSSEQSALKNSEAPFLTE